MDLNEGGEDQLIQQPEGEVIPTVRHIPEGNHVSFEAHLVGYSAATSSRCQSD